MPEILSAVFSRRVLTEEAEVPYGVDQIRAATADVIGVDIEVPEPKSKTRGKLNPGYSKISYIKCQLAPLD